MGRKVLDDDQLAALDVIAGYCAGEIYEMVAMHGPTCLAHKAAMEFLDIIDLSWPQFLSERFGMVTDGNCE